MRSESRVCKALWDMEIRTVAVVAGGGDDVWHESTNDKAYIDGAVGEEDEPPVAGAGFQLARGLGTAYRTGRVFATNAYANEETPVGVKG